MTVRSALAFLLLSCLLTARAGAADAPVFECKRKGFAISHDPPAGWAGPVYAGGPALDSWTFSTGPAAKADSLEIRIYDAKDSPLRWDTASEAKILANLKEGYVNPRVERVTNLPINGHPTRVRAVHSVGVEELLANVYFGDSLVSVMFTTTDPAELNRHRATFLAFLRIAAVRENTLKKWRPNYARKPFPRRA